MSEAIDFRVAAEMLRAGGKRPAPDDAVDTRRLIAPDVLFTEFLERRTVSIETPWPGLTRALGGGWETRRNHVVTAQAGAGKTAFVVQSVAYAAIHGEFYGVLALRDGDQWTDGVRLAQFAGVSRFKLRDRDESEMDRAREVMKGYADRLMFYDVTAKSACIADMIERGLEWAAGRGPLVVGTDSIHVMPYADAAKEAGMSLYERIGFRFESLHADLVRHDVAALTTAQASREAYRKRRVEENVEEIAAISGGHVAENAVDLLLNIGKPTAEGVRWMLIPKSRIGGQGERIPLTYDAERSLWSEADATQELEERGSRTAARAKAREATRTEDLRKRKARVESFLRKARGGRTVKELADETGFRRDWLAEVVAEFAAAGIVRQETEARTDRRGRPDPVKVWIYDSGKGGE